MAETTLLGGDDTAKTNLLGIGQERGLVYGGGAPRVSDGDNGGILGVFIGAIDVGALRRGDHSFVSILAYQVSLRPSLPNAPLLCRRPSSATHPPDVLYTRWFSSILLRATHNL
ncbi:hypothetical protein PG985_013986 [Apiospora marii]|uniref:uncharacterized protein n=1 Tax=Apiospora marii TaxID=335849 RepID=UPI00312DFB15